MSYTKIVDRVDTAGVPAEVVVVTFNATPMPAPSATEPVAYAVA